MTEEMHFQETVVAEDLDPKSQIGRLAKMQNSGSVVEETECQVKKEDMVTVILALEITSQRNHLETATRTEM